MREKLTKKNEQTGFTIIEVVLVLAIAGLIFLIVFLALPQLQKSRRDTQRKSDAGRFLSALENYAGNHNGDYPVIDNAGQMTTFVSDYLTKNGGVFSDPSTGTAYVDIFGLDLVPDAAGDLNYVRGGTCNYSNPPSMVAAGTNMRDVMVTIYQETGEVFCQDNR